MYFILQVLLDTKVINEECELVYFTQIENENFCAIGVGNLRKAINVKMFFRKLENHLHSNAYIKIDFLKNFSKINGRNKS